MGEAVARTRQLRSIVIPDYDAAAEEEEGFSSKRWVPFAERTPKSTTPESPLSRASPSRLMRESGGDGEERWLEGPWTTGEPVPSEPVSAARERRETVEVTDEAFLSAAQGEQIVFLLDAKAIEIFQPHTVLPKDTAAASSSSCRCLLPFCFCSRSAARSPSPTDKLKVRKGTGQISESPNLLTSLFAKMGLGKKSGGEEGKGVWLKSKGREKMEKKVLLGGRNERGRKGSLGLGMRRGKVADGAGRSNGRNKIRLEGRRKV